MKSNTQINWKFCHKLGFILTYAYFKFRLLWEVKSPKFQFFVFEMRYSIVNLINTIWPGALQPVLYFGSDILKTQWGTFRVRRGSQDAAVASPAFERQDIEYMRQVLETGFTTAGNIGFLDLGANIGIYTIQAASQMKSKVRVWAFEPIEENRKLLLENLKLNSLGADQVIVFPYALGAVNGEVMMHYSREFPGHSAVESATETVGKGINVQCRRADSVLEGLPECLMVKIDVEGHEVEVLSGMEKILSSSRIVWLCVEDTLNRDQIYEFLIQAGFEFQTKRTPYNSWWKLTR